nr:B3 domain-containing protein REM17-like [Solanum lycopersicum]
MKFAPKKPHFFKPILPNFKHGIKIPVAFCKHLKGCNQEHAILRKSDKKWQVKVNGRLLDEGWAIFAKENDLQLGDCLIFRHEGDFEFEVSIFGSNHFERVYEQTPKGGEEINHTCNKIISQGLVFVLCFSSLVFYFNYTSKFFELLQIVHKSISLIASSLSSKTTEKTKLNVKSNEIIPEVEAAENMPLDRPPFIFTVTPYCLTRGHVQLPVQFARDNSLMNRRCTITIRDEQRSLTFALYSSGARTYIKGQWREFCIANCLKKGDQIMLAIVDNGMNPVLRFYDLRTNASLQLEVKKPNLDAEEVSSRKEVATVPASTSANANAQFVSIIHPYAIIRALFYLPLSFARPNGLMRRCKMILKDEKQRSWSVQLEEVGPRFAITKGWRQFREANDVQVGDTYKFELIHNGTTPVAYFHRTRANASVQPEEKKPNLDARRVSARSNEADVPASTCDNANTQFVSTINPHCINSPFIQYLPSAFAKSNSLVNRRCKMILRDEKQRSWSVVLAPMGHHTAITKGWRQFREANGFQVGDTYKFELIDNGTIPIAYFHCEYIYFPSFHYVPPCYATLFQ